MKQKQKQVNALKYIEFIVNSRKSHECRDILDAELNRVAVAALMELIKDDKKRFPHSRPASTSQERKKKKGKGTTKLKNVSSTTADEMPSLYKYTSWGDDDNELHAAGQTDDQCSNHLLTNSHHSSP